MALEGTSSSSAMKQMAFWSSWESATIFNNYIVSLYLFNWMFVSWYDRIVDNIVIVWTLPSMNQCTSLNSDKKSYSKFSFIIQIISIARNIFDIGLFQVRLFWWALRGGRMVSLSVSYLIGCCSGDIKGSDIDISTVQYFEHLGDDSWTVFVAEC